MPKCNECGAGIKWIKTELGKNHPISEGSNKKLWVFMPDGKWRLMDCYESHFASCPKADNFRRGEN